MHSRETADDGHIDVFIARWIVLLPLPSHSINMLLA